MIRGAALDGLRRPAVLQAMAGYSGDWNAGGRAYRESVPVK